MAQESKSWLAIVAAGLAVMVLFFVSWLGRPPQDALVVYCAHDAVYSEEVLRDFERQTGIRVVIRFDSEATKSLSLSNLIIAERDRPQCDVFWNNEVLGTMRLAEAGLLESWRGSGWERIPDRFKDVEGRWTGFGARMRVWIINLNQMPSTDDAIKQKLSGNDLSHVAMAKPLYGTTLTHYAALWSETGGDDLKAWHDDLRGRGLKEVNGNAVVKNLVAEGVCDCGWTDTDDFFLAVDDNRPVTMLPIRTPAGKTIVIPNSVAIIKGAKHETSARLLVDFLLSEETELRLARSKARQIPLGKINVNQLPDDVRALTDAAADGVDLNQLGKAYASCLQWLAAEYSE